MSFSWRRAPISRSLICRSVAVCCRIGISAPPFGWLRRTPAVESSFVLRHTTSWRCSHHVTPSVGHLSPSVRTRIPIGCWTRWRHCAAVTCRSTGSCARSENPSRISGYTCRRIGLYRQTHAAYNPSCLRHICPDSLRIDGANSLEIRIPLSSCRTSNGEFMISHRAAVRCTGVCWTAVVYWLNSFRRRPVIPCFLTADGLLALKVRPLLILFSVFYQSQLLKSDSWRHKQRSKTSPDTGLAYAAEAWQAHRRKTLTHRLSATIKHYLMTYTAVI